MQRWTPRMTGVDISTMPVKLSDQNKMMIMTFIDCLELPGICFNAIQPYIDNLKKEIYRQINDVTLMPTEDAIQKLIRCIVMGYTDALVIEGLAVGLLAATSLSSAATQSTMDTFKLKSGASITVEGGIVGLTTLIYTSLQRRDPRMIVHFNTFLGKDDIIDLRALIVELKVSELVLDHEFGSLSPSTEMYDEYSLQRYWWHDLFFQNPHKYHYLMGMKPDTQVLRLFLDKNFMYARQTTTRQVADAIERSKAPGVFTLYSPFNDGIVDVVLSPENIGGDMKLVSEQIAYLTVSILNELNNCPIKGIEGISDAYPKGYNLFDMVGKEELKESGNYILELSNKNTAVYESLFPPHHLLIRLLQKNGCIVVAKNRHSYTNKLQSLEIKSSVKPSSLRNQGEYWYMTTSGSNINSILKLPFVDPLRTISNDIFQINSMIGLEASRDYFLYELGLVLESISSSGINSRHIILTTDVIYIAGKPAGTTIQGNIIRKQGPETTASCGKGAASFIGAAINRTSESVLSTTPSIFVGTKAAIGENATIIKPTLASVRKLREKYEMNKQNKSALIKDTLGLQAVLREKNAKLRKFLLGGDLPEAPSFVADITITESLARQEADDTVIASFEGETEMIKPGFKPVVVPKAINDLVIKTGNQITSQTPEVPYQSIITMPPDIRSSITEGKFPKREEFTSTIMLYSSPTAPRKSNYKFDISGLVNKYKVKTQEVPVSSVEVSLYNRPFIQPTVQTQTVSHLSPMQIVPAKKPQPVMSIAYSTTMTVRIIPIDITNDSMSYINSILISR